MKYTCAKSINNWFGIGWASAEFECCVQPYAKRGKRVDEVIELVLADGMVEFHGGFYDFERRQMSRAPSKPVPFYADGHRELAESGATDNIVMRWVFDGLGFDAPLEVKQDSMKRFADTYINAGWQQ